MSHTVEKIMSELLEFILDILWPPAEAICRFIGWLCYAIGWLFLRPITLGAYPPSGKHQHNKYFVAWVGLFMAIIAVCLVWFK
jgi:hypothetical protein